jgi:FkbM family methyltransferase
MEMSVTTPLNINTKTGFLNLLRRPLLNSHLEREVLKVTIGRPPRDLVCRVVPNHYQYPSGSLRNVKRHGFVMNLDISDLVQWYAYWGFRDPSHEALISICKPGDIVLDIGANIGLTALRMSTVAGAVYAFEPDSQNYSDCLNHLHANEIGNVQVFPYALGSEEGLGSLCQIASGNRGCIWIDTSDARESSSVQVTTVDHFCASQGISRVDLIKIDTEGAELAALKGARKTIERWKPRLFVEVDDRNLQRTGDSSNALLDFLFEAGYTLRHAESGLVLRSNSDLAGGHFDIICETFSQ